MAIDTGMCLFCGSCAQACQAGRIEFSQEHRLAVANRADLVVGGNSPRRPSPIQHHTAKRHFPRSFRLRQVSAGGCNACEADLNVLGTIAYDIGRFGIEFVASPRHADAIVVTGPVSKNMAVALKKTWAATPAPKVAIAVGSCAISGGPFAGSPEVLGGVDSLVSADLYIPGCPPHPLTILDGLLRMLGRLQ